MPDSLFNKALACNFIKKERVWQRSFPMDFVNLLRTPFFQNTFRRLLLEIKQRRNYGPVSVKETFCEQLKTNP